MKLISGESCIIHLSTPMAHEAGLLDRGNGSLPVTATACAGMKLVSGESWIIQLSTPMAHEASN
eukprot:CAMPEP_0181295368 /NCGR_PEP_ID=MMETSP1101-20121128/4110_1 /TAXON_ID=46948 /ORGANISM="Rhodomonas abbreviata, Strain Caron Lab Isolate" /LENGTH=63 /DNA_ID=CAMNT_0023400115 /DNA_START=438 /DNA_END=629 /DNA_ORIENTATION=+